MGTLLVSHKNSTGEAVSSHSSLRRRRDMGALASTSNLHVSRRGKANRGSTGGRWWSERSAKCRAIFPVVMFLVHALLSFVGVVVIPMRLTYELLVRPDVQDKSTTANMIRGIAHENSRDIGVRFFSLAGIGPSNERGPQLWRTQGIRGGLKTILSLGMEGANQKANSVHRKAGTGGSRSLQSGDDDDGSNVLFKYNSSTNFSLCSTVNLDSDVVRDALVEVLELGDKVGSL